MDIYRTCICFRQIRGTYSRQSCAVRLALARSPAVTSAADRIAYSAPEAARAMIYSETRIRRSIREGDLKAGRLGDRGGYRILTEDLKSCLRDDGVPIQHQPHGPAASR